MVTLTTSLVPHCAADPPRRGTATFFISTSHHHRAPVQWWSIALLIGRAKHQRASITYLEPLGSIGVMLAPRAAHVARQEHARARCRALPRRAMRSFGEWNRDIEADSANRLIMTGIRSDARARRDGHRVAWSPPLRTQTLDNAELTDELSASRTELESQIKRPVRALAYPVGRRIAREMRIRHALTAAGYRIGLSNSSGATRVSPMSLRKVMPLDPFDIHRLATDRRFSDAMYLTQIAVPPLAYIGNHNKF
jgi:hypothetical protein